MLDLCYFIKNMNSFNSKLKKFILIFFLFALAIKFSFGFSPKYGIAHQWRSYKSNFQKNIKYNQSDVNVKFLVDSLSLINQFPEKTNLLIENTKISDLNLKLSSESVSKTIKELFLDVDIDHYNIPELNSPKSTFKLRYLVNDNYFKANGPILFYCGNEGPIEDFYEATGFLRETLAKEFNGLAVYGEHRFFGKSFPFDPQFQDYDSAKNKYLTSEQALSDFIQLINHIKEELNLESSKVIAFGGSYGGMLSSWIRMKFPHIIDAAIASSAPILLFEKPSNEFFQITTNTYKRYETQEIQCVDHIWKGFQFLGNLIKDLKNQFGVNGDVPKEIAFEINRLFNVCNQITKVFELDYLLLSLEDSIVEMAQYNYPYKVNTMPEFPAKEMCEAISKANPSLAQKSEETTDLEYLAAVSSKIIELNNLACYETIVPDGISTDNLNGWSFMACTEMIMTMEKNGVTDMFYPSAFNLKDYSEDCERTWKGKVKEKWIFDFYGGRNFEKESNNYSNIIFVNGLMDPWYSGCPKSSLNPSIKIITADSAHHLDLRLPDLNDPESIKKAREEIRKSIFGWLK